MENRSIVICGIRGVPAGYGGFETFAEQLGPRLAKNGWRVTVYCRSHLFAQQPVSFQGMELRYLPAIQHKYLETISHSFLTFVDVAWRRERRVLLCNAANSPFLPILRLAGVKVAVNVDGIERQRKKWNLLGRLWYRLGEVCSILFANEIVADARVIEEYYRGTYGASSTVIPYGFDARFPEERSRKLSEGIVSDAFWNCFGLREDFGITPDNYLLYVSRLEPENNAHVVLEAFNRLPEGLKSLPLVVVGDAPYSSEYKQHLRSIAGKEVIFTGYQFGDRYRALQLGARAYIQATEVGGTHPALVEALGFGNAVVANDTPEHREVLEEAGLLYRRNDVEALTAHLASVLSDRKLRQGLRLKAAARASEKYSWEQVATDYEALFYRLGGGARLNE